MSTSANESERLQLEILGSTAREVAQSGRTIG